MMLAVIHLDPQNQYRIGRMVTEVFIPECTWCSWTDGKHTTIQSALAALRGHIERAENHHPALPELDESALR